MAGEEDETIRLVRPASVNSVPPPKAPAPRTPPAGLGQGLTLGLVVLAFLAAGGSAWWFWPRGAPPLTGWATPREITPAPTREAAPAPPPLAERLSGLPPLLDEAAIAEHRAATPIMLRYAGNGAVFVLDFPTLEAQGAALNRVAALVEKAGLPRHRVLTEAEMAEAISRADDTPGTFYYGHNYRGGDLARFFRLAVEAGVALRAEEVWVAARLQQARALVPAGQEIVLLSIAAPDARMAEGWRNTILRHELGHGLYGTTPAYAAAIRRAWNEAFTEAERAAFRAFLGREGYDTEIEELMVDETQAYLLHTPDPRFFAPGHVGMTEAEVARLRALLREGAGLRVH